MLFGAPTFESGGDDAGDHDDGVSGCYALGLSVQADSKGIVCDGVSLVFLHAVLMRKLHDLSRTTGTQEQKKEKYK